MYTDLQTLKEHLRIDVDVEDNYLLQLIDAAENAVENHIGVQLSDFVEESGYLPPALQQAILIMAGNLYNNRESVAYTSTYSIPMSLEYMLAQFKKYDA
jgi:uncharacterized phage protein (predicted DNA packaging)